MAQQDMFNQRYASVDYVAQGSFGVIASVTCSDTGGSRAIKLLDSNDPTVMNEIKLLYQPKFHHENKIRYYETGSSKLDRRNWIVETGFLSEDWKSFLKRNIGGEFLLS